MTILGLMASDHFSALPRSEHLALPCTQRHPWPHLSFPREPVTKHKKTNNFKKYIVSFGQFILYIASLWAFSQARSNAWKYHTRGKTLKALSHLRGYGTGQMCWSNLYINPKCGHWSQTQMKQGHLFPRHTVSFVLLRS